MATSITYERSITAHNPMPPDELMSAEKTLARLIAAAFAEDHPELFGERHRDIMGSRPESRPEARGQDDRGMTTAGEIDELM